MPTLKDSVNAIEALRREPFSTLPQDAVHGLDYASAGLKIDLAALHLDEALPNRQQLRTQAAYKLLAEGVQELGVWLRGNGYEV